MSTRISAVKSQSLDLRVPNKTTRKAFADVSKGKIIRHLTNKAAFADLEIWAVGSLGVAAARLLLDDKGLPQLLLHSLCTYA